MRTRLIADRWCQQYETLADQSVISVRNVHYEHHEIKLCASRLHELFDFPPRTQELDVVFTTGEPHERFGEVRYEIEPYPIAGLDKYARLKGLEEPTDEDMLNVVCRETLRTLYDKGYRWTLIFPIPEGSETQDSPVAATSAA
jgi:hypothetical protein